MKPVKLLFFTDNFPPESNAPANRTYEHCIEWVKKGAEVTVITCNPNFPEGKLFSGYKNRLYRTEMLDGIKVVRVWSYITPNRGTLKRILDYISFAISSFIASLFHKTDIIIATSPQLFTAVGGYLSAVVRRKPWIMEVRDLWPESIKVLDALDNNTILDRLERLVQFLYRKATGIVVVTDRFKERLMEDGINSEKIHVVKNGVNINRYQEMEPVKSLLEEHGLSGKFIVGYIGTHGMAHGLEMIINAAAKVNDPNVHFLFVGHGAYKNRMLALKEKLGLQNVTMLDPIPREEVQNYLSIISVALIPLRRLETFKTVIPSKIFESAAMAKPILLGVEGESKEIIESYRAGLCFIPEDENSFLEKLTKLKQNKELYQECKEGGLLLAKDFDRKKLADKMFSVIEDTI
ncbi:MAG: glycosyltransferase family 4 protein [Flavobacteriales bacterium]|nr:glycosyltransferase family 4 protein [Flavobacteriales bacterium]